jgi:hypothetical protein
MSQLHVTQIKAFLQKTFDGLIDLTDFATKSQSEKDTAFLTRSLAAFAVMHLADTIPDVAAVAVTDGGQDNGIDAIYYDGNDRSLYLVQSKWKNDGTGSVERGEIQKFITGFRDLVNARFERFNTKVQSKRVIVQDALNDARTRIVVVLIYTGQDPLADEPKRDLDDLMADINDPTELMVLRVMRQVNVHSVIATGVGGAPIDFDVVLADWGQTREPIKSFYGQVSAADVAGWYDSFYPRLFAPNLRMFLGATDVNDGIQDTLRTEPDSFWYFNNGITALCRSITKKPIGGSSRDSGTFECKGVSIVNGAQTVGSIANANATHPAEVAQARVQIRFISLDECPEDFASQITRYANTQNRIERRDFLALDLEQDRLRTELRIEGIEYVYKSGDVHPAGRPGFDVTEATVALACSQPDVALAVQAKREIGRLWENIDRTPYKLLFNPSVPSIRLWNLVRVLRTVDATLQDEHRARDGRDAMFAVHGNRLITWRVMQELRNKSLDAQDSLTDELLESIRKMTREALNRITEETDLRFPDTYLASTFKNLTRCREIAKAVVQGETS